MPQQNGEMKKPDLYVVARFLEKLWRSGREYRKTELQMAVRLNYNVYLKYLEWLENKELIKIVKENEKHEIIKITTKGLEAYHKLVCWIRDAIGEEVL